jgi:hypothetical protein
MRYGLFALLAGVALSGTSAPPARPPAPVQLYTLDCGRIGFPAMDRFSDTDDIPAEPGALVATCFLIHHGRD